MSQIAINDESMYCVLDKTKFFKVPKSAGEEDDEDVVMIKQFDKEIVSIDCFTTDEKERVFVNLGNKIIAYNEEDFAYTEDI